MESIVIMVSCNTAQVLRAPSIITTGTVGLPVTFIFDECWTDLCRTAIFKSSAGTFCVTDIDTTTNVPWEALAKPEGCLQIGVYGANADGTVVIPSVFATVGKIYSGVDPSGDPSTKPTPSVWEQMQGQLKANEAKLDAHATDKTNPHGVTAEQAGAAPDEPLLVTITGDEDEYHTDFSYSDIFAAFSKNQSVYAFLDKGGEHIPLSNIAYGTAVFSYTGYDPTEGVLKHYYFEIHEDGTIVHSYAESHGSSLICALDYEEDGKPYCPYAGAAEIHDAIITNRSVYLYIEELLYPCTYSDGTLAKFDVFTTTASGPATYLNYKTYVIDDAGSVTVTETSCAPRGYGIGEDGGKVFDDFNVNTKKTGFYQATTKSTGALNAPGDSFAQFKNGTMSVEGRTGTLIHQTASYHEYAARRYTVDGAKNWSAWEYENPPMVYGKEYRTVERFMGKPVYAQAFQYGSISGDVKTASLGCAITGVVRIEGYLALDDGDGNLISYVPLPSSTTEVFVYPNGEFTVTDMNIIGNASITIYYTKD